MNTPINDGGPVYPSTLHIEDRNGTHFEDHPGMTLRDWFAGQALAGHMASPDNEFAFQWTHESTGEKRLLGYGSNPSGGGWKITRTPNEAMAQTMWAKADAMIAERNKTHA